ncbi:hypothetical protein BJ508DRAFT_323491 [Ascobolus immersus RN42]|uniref:Extracellular membrane protein CFEM domain-containing protein n=1 Tax=Ascobolus immersus RN42 TaxID=1160509 RepID=A0A3N4IEL7_ASCIM|nr:hypothetical protein BJ508DRAFT_323491 [Ascobolus immersus RN42]
MAFRSFQTLALFLLSLLLLTQQTLASLPMPDYPECITYCLSAASFADVKCPVRNFALNGNRPCLCQDKAFMARYTDCIMNGPWCGSVRDDSRAWTKPEEEYYAWIYMMFECKEMGVSLDGIDFGEKFGIRRVKNTQEVTSTVGATSHPGGQFGIGHGTTAPSADTSPRVVIIASSVFPQTTIFSYLPLTTALDNGALPCSTPATPTTSTITQIQTTSAFDAAGFPYASTVTVTATLTITPSCAQFDRVPITTVFTTLPTPIFQTRTQALKHSFTTDINNHEVLPDGGFGGALPDNSKARQFFTPVEGGGDGLAGEDDDAEDLPRGFVENQYTEGNDNTTEPVVGAIASKNPVSGGVGKGDLRMFGVGGLVLLNMAVGMFIVFGNL